MTLAQFNIEKLEKINGISIPNFSDFPKQFDGFWIQITKIFNNKNSFIACFYLNDDNPSGTVIVSDYLNSKYPDMYVSFYMDGLADRLYINPSLRKRGYLSIIPLVLRTAFYHYQDGFIVDGSDNRSDLADKAYSLAKNFLEESELNNNPVSANSIYNIEPPRDPIYPLIWYNQRVGGKND